MPKKIELKYGESSISLEMPDNAENLHIKDPEMAVDEQTFIRQVETALPGDAAKLSRVAVVVADKTRRCGYETWLPVLTKLLERAGVPGNRITFYIAYGTHAAQSREECLNVYGNVYDEYRFIHHDCTDISLFERCGETRRGTEVHIRKDILGSDLIISFGALSHHYFAGYGGGRKLLFPGLGYRSDIYRNHSLFLDGPAGCLSEGCRPGNLEGNPLADDLQEIDGFLKKPRISIHGILDSKARVCRLVVGTAWKQFLEACSSLDDCYKSRSQKRYDLVVASCGGHPKDINFIQAHKAINNAAMFVKEGGTLVVLARCPDGIGSDTFIQYFDYPDFRSAFDAINRDYKGNGGTALSLMSKTGMSKTSRINIFLKTDLDDTICSTIGVKKLDDMRLAGLVRKSLKNTAFIRNASLLIR